jgi:hypothetical protein
MSIYSLTTALYVQLLIHAFSKVLTNGLRAFEQTCRCVDFPIYAELTNLLIDFAHPRMPIFASPNALPVNPPLEKATWLLGDLSLVIVIESQCRARNLIIEGRKRRIRPVVHDVEVAHIHVVVVVDEELLQVFVLILDRYA